MFDALLAQVEPNRKSESARLRAPLQEQFAREVEEATFYDTRDATTFSYERFSTCVKRFGCCGITHLNERHMQACFSNIGQIDLHSQMTASRAIYFSNKGKDAQIDTNSNVDKGGDVPMTQDDDDPGISVAYLLRLAILMCKHTSQAAQLQEMWLLVNPTLQDTISARAFIEFVEVLADIVVDRTFTCIESLSEQQDVVKESLRDGCLVYLAKAKAMKGAFLADFAARLNDQEMTFAQFAAIAQTICMNSSQLRMRITGTPETRTSQDVAISQVSTIIISFLTQKEQVQQAQQVCRKWYMRFAPQIVPKIALNYAPWANRQFRLIYEGCPQERSETAQPNEASESLYLALVTDQKSDVRENCGRTNYISAGSSSQHQAFTWTIEKDGTLKAANADGAQECLAAHRTYVNDCMGKEATFVISTNYQGHENHWRLERFGDLDRQRYVITLADSKCVKDLVNQVGWAMTASLPQQDQKSVKAVVRDETSRYVYIRKLDPLTRSMPQIPVWRLEPVSNK